MFSNQKKLNKNKIWT